MRRAERGAVVVAAVSLAMTAACTFEPRTEPEARPPPPVVDRWVLPVYVVTQWVEARNRGDVVGGMSLLDDTAVVLGHDVHDPAERTRLVTLLRGQAEAGFHLQLEECREVAESVECRSRAVDRVLDRLGLVVGGTRTYVVREGLILRAMHREDDGSAASVASALGRLRSWIAEHHPLAVRTIYGDGGGLGYTSAEGARAMLRLLDEYLESGAAAPSR